MKEIQIVEAIVKDLKEKGFKVATEVANFHRSVDIVALDEFKSLWAIECKVSDIGKAIVQLKTHQLSADKVFIATANKKMKYQTLKKIKEAGLGLFYVMEDGTVKLHFECSGENRPWLKSRNKLIRRIMEIY